GMSCNRLDVEVRASRGCTGERWEVRRTAFKNFSWKMEKRLKKIVGAFPAVDYCRNDVLRLTLMPPRWHKLYGAFWGLHHDLLASITSMTARGQDLVARFELAPSSDLGQRLESLRAALTRQADSLIGAALRKRM